MIVTKDFCACYRQLMGACSYSATKTRTKYGLFRKTGIFVMQFLLIAMCNLCKGFFIRESVRVLLEEKYVARKENPVRYPAGFPETPFY
jgi:hypothetical protein